MKIVIIQKSNFITCPPIISVLLILKRIGVDVDIVTINLTDFWKSYCVKNGIGYYEIPDSKENGVIGKIISYLNFKKKVGNILKKKKEEGEEFALWVEGAQTILALGKLLIEYKSVLHILELHDHNKYQLKAISRVIHHASAIAMPEYNRAFLYKVWFKLDKLPYVLPNKPYFIPSSEEVEKYSIKYKDKLNVFKEKKVILYQGHIGFERDLSNYLRAVCKLGEEYAFVVLGKDHGAVSKYKEIMPSLIHIDYIPAPEYLIFTKYAYIGVVSYVPDDLNNVYCAPNKIWECTYYGLPILANDIPGLRYTIQYKKAGCCVDEFDVDDICRGIRKIDTEYDSYSKNAKLFYNSADNQETVSCILKKL